jgi:pimeloyl-ACP methyl ester carboxylesterase
MDVINQIPFNFDPRIGLIVSIMVGFLVFAVSLDLTWEKLLRVLKRPKQARDNLMKVELLGSGFLPLDKEKIKSIKLPVLLIRGEKSPKLWHYLLDELKNLIPHSIQRMIPDASHIMHEDNPSNYNSIVLSFLRNNDNVQVRPYRNV